MRAYLPLTIELLDAFAADGSWGGGTVVLHTVTPALRAALPGADDEELEFAAASAAADASLALVAAAGGGGSARRVVLALELAAPAVEVDDDVTAVAVPGPVPWRCAASILADGSEAEADVRAAVAAGDPALVDGHDLLWFGVQERDRLLG